MSFQGAVGLPRKGKVSPESSTLCKVICGHKFETKAQAIAFKQKKAHPDDANLPASLLNVQTN